MEEQVGQAWHKFITKLADNDYSEAVIHLSEIKAVLAVYFRALGGDGGLQLVKSDATPYKFKRNWLKKIARSHEKVNFAWKDDYALRLPGKISAFANKDLNRDLYFWLTALAAVNIESENNWVADNQNRVLQTLDLFPGLKQLYVRLAEAHCKQRETAEPTPDISEQSIRQALLMPGTVAGISNQKVQPSPVILWLHPSPPELKPRDKMSEANGKDQKQSVQKDAKNIGKKTAEEVNKAEENRGLIAIRMENIFSWGEFIACDRSTDDEEDPDNALEAAKDMDHLAITQGDETSAVKIKFDLDLPSSAADDKVLNDGILLPEWHWKKQQLLPDRCRIVNMVSNNQETQALPAHLKSISKTLRKQFQTITSENKWFKGLSDGSDIDLNAYLDFETQIRSGYSVDAEKLYMDMRKGGRNLSCLLLADLSLSTDTWVDNKHRVIDVIQDSLFLFGECLQATGDRFGMYGFSSRGRDPVRFHNVKDFDESYSAEIRGRIAAIKPGYYTRMGAAIRYSAQLMSQQATQEKILLIISDGKPNDLDIYEGRYGIEDTRHAIRNARNEGLKILCITIDREANEYLPYLFGKKGFVLIRNATDLPRALLSLYAKLTF